MTLQDDLAQGKLDWSDIDRACHRILRKQLEFSVKPEFSNPNAAVVFCEKHRSLAREVAARSIVLLQNQAVEGQTLLPIDASRDKNLAVVGRLADVANTGDKGSSQVFSPHVVTPFQGIKAALPDAEVILVDPDLPLEDVAATVSQADYVLCIVGYDNRDEGEYLVPPLKENSALLKLFPQILDDSQSMIAKVFQGDQLGAKDDNGAIEVGAGGDRTSLRLRPEDEDLIQTVSTVNPKIIVSITAAGAVLMETWRHKVPALLMNWYGGCEGGHGLADVLFGHTDPSGRLPFSIPEKEEHLPWFDRDAESIRYDQWHGQWLLDKLDVPAAFPFGFGLSYTRFSFSYLSVSMSHNGSQTTTSCTVSVTVANIGLRKGRHIVQVYGRPDDPGRSKKVLIGFSVVELDAKQAKQVSIEASLRPLQRYVGGGFILYKNNIEIGVASNAADDEGLWIRCHLTR